MSRWLVCAWVLAGCNSILGIHHFDGDAVDAPIADAAHDTAPPIDSGSDGWWDPQWARRSLITIDNSSVTEPLPAFPVLLTLTPGTFSYADAAPDGADLRVIAADNTTELPHEVDVFTINAVSYVWVAIDIPAAASPRPTAWLYYDNPSALTDADPVALWAGNISVHHLSDLTDATGSGHDGSAQQTGIIPTETTGIVGEALDVISTSNAIDLAESSDYAFTTTFSASLWMKASQSLQPQECIVCKGGHAWQIETDAARTSAAFATGTAGITETLDTTIAIENGLWHHVAVSMGGGVKTIYIDGVAESVGSGAGPIDITTDPMSFGGVHGNPSHGLQQTDLDEIRITSLVRPAAWFAAEHLSITDPTFVVLGPIQQVP